MLGIARKFSRLPNYIETFGAIHGPRLFFEIERSVPRKSTAVRKYTLPDYEAPVWLRETISDHAIFFQCLVKEGYNFSQFPQSARLMAAYRRMIKKGVCPLIIDCGGNIGLTTVWLARKFPEARIIAVEPDDANFSLLRINTEHLGDRFTPICGGIWHEKADLEIINPDSGSAALRIGTASSPNLGKTIRAYTIDEVCVLAGVNSPFIVKIDIEGAQESLFKSNTDWVSKTHMIVIELDDWLMPWQGTSRAFFSCVSRYPFDYLMSGESLFCFHDLGSDVIVSCVL
jgi:FkbM family methyltransferase